ncbi:Gfo/Idh/MocA family oxidoreductase [Taibaiella lutea]|uniref:Gfo/Idh/MocA family oxidoreductase n=1 Tax=Taibaiella lutea TaxID=2608001 RepID=A0A5M6CJT3_9BACT|nr:Gfo/Idh/MocA family oxidoreductase [Taibaiella lutea]KAA5533369.1 Gfo/Idh/MocA family oxidoreductase [Taibaiella lutea]
MINIGIIGYGYWGPNLVRNFNGVDGCSVCCVSDLRENRLEAVQKMYPKINVTTDADAMINDPTVDAIVIATPVHTHFPLAQKALKAGKHVLLEKPMTQSAEEAEILIELSKQTGKVLMVDHTFLYTGAVQKIKSLIETGEIGDLQYFDSTRVNLGLIQHDVNVLWDLAPHDLSILFYLYNEKPYSVQATGVCHTNNDIENIAYLTVNYSTRFIAHFNCSWSSPVKLRNIMIGGDKKMILFDDVEPTEKVKVYAKGFDIKTDEDKRNLLVNYRSGDVYLPHLPNTEALSGMAADFVSAIVKGTKPVSNFETGIEVVRILEAAQKSIKQKGQEIIL